MVQQISTGGSEGDVSFEDYMARYEQKPIYYSKLQEFATSGRVPMEIRGKAINLAIMRAKQEKKIG